MPLIKPNHGVKSILIFFTVLNFSQIPEWFVWDFFLLRINISNFSLKFHYYKMNYLYYKLYPYFIIISIFKIINMTAKYLTYLRVYLFYYRWLFSKHIWVTNFRIFKYPMTRNSIRYNFDYVGTYLLI